MSDKSLSRLLNCLSDGQAHSGESLGAQLGVSRAAVWKQVKQAQALGLPVRAQKGLGYQLPSAMRLLDAEDIASHLHSSVRTLIPTVTVLFQIDSTNNEALKLLRAGVDAPILVLAEMQSAGRGRRGRPWYSPFGRSIYMTLGWRYTQGLAALEGLSLVVGLMLLRSLQKLGAKDLALKWPNDVMWRQQKLAGILVDVQGDPAGECQVAIGLGLNVELPISPEDAQQSCIDQPWVDLNRVLKSQQKSLPCRNVLVANLLNELVPALRDIQDSGFATYQREWQAHDYCLGKSLQVNHSIDSSMGRGTGVNSQGAYTLETSRGMLAVSGGEISIRVQKSDD